VTRRRVTTVAGIATVMAALYGVLVPPTRLKLIDHIGYRDTVARMRGGQDYYSAYLDAFGEGLGIDIGQARGVRAPTIFLVWRWIPDDALYLTYLGGVVVLTAVLLALAVPERPFASLAAAGYLLVAGRSFEQAHIDAWMLCEIWTVPALAGGILAWRRGRDGAAVACIVVAVLIREIAAVALLTGALVALLRRRPLRPWVVGTVVAAGAWAVLMAVAASQVAGSDGDVPPLLSSARFPISILEMMSWHLPEPRWALGILVFAGAALAVHRSRDLAIGGIALAIPLLGLLAGRSYWGIIPGPFAWWLAAVAVSQILRPDAAFQEDARRV